ncbi:MAG: ubiquinol-cytochrome c reductase iron-sulfur subunit [Betaproteobacteria bacterium]|nr:MAG: ubiquinol-cytochrome c reductase iron-sulfur subunit [Betaproteobacteria bacterium]
MSTIDAVQSPADEERRKLLARATAAAGGLALAGASLPFVASLRPSERAKAQAAPIEVDTALLRPGELKTVEWRGKPVWILGRTPAMLSSLESVRSRLTDPDSTVVSQQPEYARNPTRSINPELFVTISLCTHLGCVPTYAPEPGSIEGDWPGGFYCPCHGSKFDLAGRVYKGSPAPTNLVIPPHQLRGGNLLVIGYDAADAPA